MNPDQFNRKMTKLGLTRSNYQERLKVLPSVRIKRHLYTDEAVAWANKHAGDAWIWSSPTQTDYTDVYFANESDALVFKLRFATA